MRGGHVCVLTEVREIYGPIRLWSASRLDCWPRGSDDAGTTQATTPEPEVYEPSPVAEPFEPQPVTLSWVYHDVGKSSGIGPSW